MGKLYLIGGDDDFAVKERARALAVELSGGEPEENPAVEIIPGDSDDLKPETAAGRFLDALRTPPFLSDNKVVWLRHFKDLDLFSGRETQPVYSEISAFLTEGLPQELTVLIDAIGFDQRKSFPKALKAAGAAIEILNAGKTTDKRFADDRRFSIREFCQEAGKAIDPAAAQFLTETLGGDSGTLRNELDKLCAYAGNADRITLEDCRAVCSRTPDAVSWEFTGAVTSRNIAGALKLLDIMLQQGEAEMRLMYTLSGEFQKLIQTRLAMKQLRLDSVGPNTFAALPPALKEKYPDNPLLKLHPYRAYKVCESAAGFSSEELAGALELIRNANRALVSGGGDRRIILEQLVIRLASRRT